MHTFTLSAQDVQVVLNALAELPLKISFNAFMSLKEQLEAKPDEPVSPA